jgi:hypothetical protein
MLAISESLTKQRQAATERTETPKEGKLELGKSSSQLKRPWKHHTPKALCLFMVYEEAEKEDSKDLDRLLSAESTHGYEAYTISLKKADTHPWRHLEGNINRGHSLCIETVRKWKDIEFDMIAFGWHNMPHVLYLEYVPPSKDVFAFILGSPGFLNAGGIVDIPCTPHFYERHLAEKGSLEELFDITFLHEHQLPGECFLSEAVGPEGSKHTIYCKLVRQRLEDLDAHSCTKDDVLSAYDKMIKDHGGVEDICMIRLT